VPAFAQTTYPERQIHALVGFPPGSGADILARYFSRRLSELAGKPVIVENKPGATSNIAVGLAAKAKPDGYTMLYSANSNMAGNRFLFKDLPFDTVTDFTPVAMLSQTTFILVVAPGSPVNSIAELTRSLKANNRAKFAYTNQIGLLSTQFYRNTVGAEAVAVSYRTATDALPDIQNGTIDFMIIDGTFGMGQIKAGRIKPLAVSTAQRLPTLPTSLR
jgi:tripartite-type tricarboxylate transporter receptor subunit TctC